MTTERCKYELVTRDAAMATISSAQQAASGTTRTVLLGWYSVLMLEPRLNGEECEWPVIKHSSSSAVLAYDPTRRVAIVDSGEVLLAWRFTGVAAADQVSALSRAAKVVRG
jgi:hypothetical protein